jgi:hypothetical protein
LSICVLSLAESGRLEHYAVWPTCKKSHAHIPRKEADELVAAGTHRYVGGRDTAINSEVSMIVEVDTSRTWQPVATAGLMGLRTWGLPKTI